MQCVKQQRWYIICGSICMHRLTTQYKHWNRRLEVELLRTNYGVQLTP